MKAVLFLILFGTSSLYAGEHQLCRSIYGEIEFVVSSQKTHIFLAPHSFHKSQRQIASLETGNRENIDLWEPILIDSVAKIKLWRHDNVNFKSDFKKYVEISDRDGKTVSFSIICSKI